MPPSLTRTLPLITLEIDLRRGAEQQRGERVVQGAGEADVVQRQRHQVGRHAGGQRADVIAAEHARAAEGGDLQHLARAHSRRPPGPPYRCRSMPGAPRTAGDPRRCWPAIDRERHLAPASRIARTGAMPEARRDSSTDNGLPLSPTERKERYSEPSSFTQCACHTSSPVQPRSSAYCPGRQPNWREAVGNILVVLGQMGVQHHPLVARQQCGARAIRSRLTENGEQGESPTRTIAPSRASWKCIHHPDAVLQDTRPRAPPRRSGGSPPADSPDAHRPPRRMEAQPHLARSRDRVVQPRPVGEQIEVVPTSWRSGCSQFSQPEPARSTNISSRPPNRAQIG